MNATIRKYTLVFVCAIQAGPNPSAVRDVDKCRTKTVAVIVRDRLSLPIDDLGSDDFVAKVKGKPARIVSVSKGSQPLRIVILLDTSGSMRGGLGASQWKVAVDIVAQFAAAFSSRSQLAFLTFDQKVRETIDFAAGNSAVLAKLNAMADGKGFSKEDIQGRTAMYDAIHRGLGLLGGISDGDTIFLVTDGGENSSRLKESAIEKQLQQSGVRFYAVLMREGVAYRTRTPEELNGPTILDDLAQVSGGEVFGPVGYDSGGKLTYSSSNFSYGERTTLQQALMMFYEGLFHFKSVQVEIPDSAESKHERLELRLGEESRKKWKEAKISYRTEFLPCPSANP